MMGLPLTRSARTTHISTSSATMIQIIRATFPGTGTSMKKTFTTSTIMAI
jgi:hypothetical protein